MLRTVLNLTHRRPRARSLPCRPPSSRARRIGLLALRVAVALLPLVARAVPPGPDVVAEATFLCDPLPPGGRDLNLILSGTPDDAGRLGLEPRLQLALGLGEETGLTADVAVDPASGSGLHSPALSLKRLLRPPEDGGLGVAASLDLHTGDAGTEGGLGVGLIAPLGRLALRGSATLATPFAGFMPHLHCGASAALALGASWRLLAEAVTEIGDGRPALSAGPTVKVALGERAALAAGALVDLRAPGRTPAFVVQLTQGM